MVSNSFIWKPWPIESIDDILKFERQYQELVINTPDDWTYEDGYIPHDFGDGSLCLMGRGHFKIMADAILTNPNDAFIKAGCTPCESLVLHSFLGFESCLYRRDSYYGHIPPFADNMCQILDNALEKMPCCDCVELYRACVYGDRENFEIGEVFEPKYTITTSADSLWKDMSVNRFVIKPLPPHLTKARSIYRVHNKANECQVSFLSSAKFIITFIDNWGESNMVFYMGEIV